MERCFLSVYASKITQWCCFCHKIFCWIIWLLLLKIHQDYWVSLQRYWKAWQFVIWKAIAIDWSRQCVEKHGSVLKGMAVCWKAWQCVGEWVEIFSSAVQRWRANKIDGNFNLSPQYLHNTKQYLHNINTEDWCQFYANLSPQSISSQYIHNIFTISRQYLHHGLMVILTFLHNRPSWSDSILEQHLSKQNDFYGSYDDDYVEIFTMDLVRLGSKSNPI